MAVYYMQNTLKRKISTGDVIAAFNVIGWKNPANPANKLQVAGTLGWLDTSDMTDIKTVWAGQNYVEHDLPKAAKPKK
ncbi:hypothetical protein BST17_25615 [Mycolicibacterium bacteremicum]|uniref:Uncharacterized protein n=1 Tax=Mycolicibacterium bacteremicum TaxID=564198 RepID=A0A1W9YPK3_MYCBA|nr:hypothetical protein BST17_25615 [Mycolicibacterium bacteremicum]